MRHVETERSGRCRCGKGWVLFESSYETGGMAVATEATVFACPSCAQVLFERNVRDGESFMLLTDTNPTVEVIRTGRRDAARRRWRPWTPLITLWNTIAARR